MKSSGGLLGDLAVKLVYFIVAVCKWLLVRALQVKALFAFGRAELIVSCPFSRVARCVVPNFPHD